MSAERNDTDYCDMCDGVCKYGMPYRSIVVQEDAEPVAEPVERQGTIVRVEYGSLHFPNATQTDVDEQGVLTLFDETGIENGHIATFASGAWLFEYAENELQRD